MTMTENDTTQPWDDICVNPHEDYVASGREEGRFAGEEAGYREGWQLGQTTALEYGVELGFIRGIIETLPGNLLLDATISTKAARTLQDLQRALDQFPEAETIFRQRQMMAAPATDNEKEDDNHNDSEQHQDGNDENVRYLIQRIRTRFRLLMVQLNMTNLSLKEVLNNNTSDDSSAKDQTKTFDW